jgi:hypothetical protein
MRKKLKFLLLLIFSASLVACSPKIYGRVDLFDPSMAPLKDEGPEDTVINMINTTSGLDNASYSVNTDKNGSFESEKKAIAKGVQGRGAQDRLRDRDPTVEVGSFSSAKLEFKLKKILEGKRKSLENARSERTRL